MTFKGLEIPRTKIIRSFIALGDRINQLSTEEKQVLSLRATNENAWFTHESISMSLAGVANYLDAAKLALWAKQYREIVNPKNVGIIMAGNIPMVGFHDLLSVLISGHKALIKLSSSDSVLMRWIIETLIQIDAELSKRISLTDKLTDFDAVIATGSNNTARYFDFYFAGYPHIIRRNRNSIAVLDGTEDSSTIQKLGEDIFSYFGLGCRNVSKIYVPKDYNFETFFQGIESFQEVINKHKYANNYDYHKSILLVNREKHLDNGFLLLKVSKNIASSLAILNYEFYTDINLLKEELKSREEEIQCIVADKKNIPEAISFGNSQFPELNDYADKVDTMMFLTSL
jgi:hypothetical protein